MTVAITAGLSTFVIRIQIMNDRYSILVDFCGPQKMAIGCRQPPDELMNIQYSTSILDLFVLDITSIGVHGIFWTSSPRNSDVDINCGLFQSFGISASAEYSIQTAIARPIVDTCTLSIPLFSRSHVHTDGGTGSVEEKWAMNIYI